MDERTRKPRLDERGRQYIDVAVDGAKRMQVLINDLLTFSRVGRVDDRSVATDLGQTLDKALVNLSSAVEDTGARVERAGRLPELVGDPLLLTMLWQNLIGGRLVVVGVGQRDRHCRGVRREGVRDLPAAAQS